MPLVIAVMVIAGIFIWANRTNKDRVWRYERSIRALQKTNAPLEFETFEKHRGEGMDVKSAYEATIVDVQSQGYVPCIPIKTYTNGYRHAQYLRTPQEAQMYDSDAVQLRRKILKQVGRPVTDENIYKNFPTTYAEYERESIEAWTRKALMPKGSYFYHEKFGVCRVDKVTVFGSNGSYAVTVIGTGARKAISSNDPRIVKKLASMKDKVDLMDGLNKYL